MTRPPAEDVGAAIRPVLPHLTLGEAVAGRAGSVILAGVDMSTGQGVAAKVLIGDQLRDPRRRHGLRTEADILMSCRHPNLVRGLAFHEFDDALVLLMERVDGERLFDRALRSRLPVAEACQVLTAAARALQAVHDHGYLHGDIKPDNVLYDPHGRHRLVDLGLARRWPCLVPGQVAGTPWYMAPETIRGGVLGPAADVYALGMMAYELLAGHLPFPPADGPVEIMRQQIEAMPFPLAAAAPHLPADLIRIVMRAIEKDAAQRPGSATAFADHVQPSSQRQ